MEFPSYEDPFEDSSSTPPPPTLRSRHVRSASVSSIETTIYNPEPFVEVPAIELPTRGRRRSTTFVAPEHPFETPNSASDYQLNRLIRSINRSREYERHYAQQVRAQSQQQASTQATPHHQIQRGRSPTPAPRRDHTPRPRRDSLHHAQSTDPDSAQRKAALTESGGYTGNTYRGTELTGRRSEPTFPRATATAQAGGASQGAQQQDQPAAPSTTGVYVVDFGFPPLSTNEERLRAHRASQSHESEALERTSDRNEGSEPGLLPQHSRSLPVPPSPSLSSAPFTGFDLPILPRTTYSPSTESDLPILPSTTYSPSESSEPIYHRTTYVYPNTSGASSNQSVRELLTDLDMSYQNYLDSPQGTPNSNSRQAPPSPAQNMNPNGMNGGMGMGAGYPTPAGHQQDLNHIMQMVENLSAQLAQNNAMTSNIVEMTGRVREIAQKHNLTNEELIVLSAHSIDGQARNLDKELSELEKKYDAACYDREEWKKLSVYCCQVLSNILDLARDFKFKHEADTLTWHRNYRDQLAAEREENLKLRCEINDMRAAAIRSNTHMNDLRRHISDSKAFYEQEVRITQWRQQARFWKRMAMPYLPDDDPEFSDDDDIIDPEEKKRLQAEKEAKEGEGEGGASAN